MSFEQLNTVVVKRCAHQQGASGTELALVQSICDAPTFGLVRPNGSHYNWRQDLTRIATAEETAEYWKQRATHAENLLLSKKPPPPVPPPETNPGTDIKQF